MSGSAPNTVNFNILPIAQDLIPRAAEGSKGCALQVYWNNIFAILPTFPIVQNINLLLQYNTGQLTTIQAVWIDNSTVPYPVTLLANETGQTINVPAFWQGMYPIFASTAPVFTLILNIMPDPNYGQSIGACTTKLIFLNTPQRYFAKYAAIAAPFTYSNNITLTAAGTPVMLGALGTGGIGLVSTGSTTIYYRFFAADFAVILGSAASASGIMNIQLREQGHSSVPFIRALLQWINVSASTQGIVWSRELVWPDGGLLQYDPLNSWFLMAAGAGFPAGDIAVTCNISGEVVTIA
jgi:hypothetical protein